LIAEAPSLDDTDIDFSQEITTNIIVQLAMRIHHRMEAVATQLGFKKTEVDMLSEDKEYTRAERCSQMLLNW